MKKILLSMMACAALCACTNDDIALNDGLLPKSDDGEKVYVKLSLSMADATRGTRADEDTGDDAGEGTETTTTENDGNDYVTSKDSIEYAQDYESTINNMNIVLTCTSEATPADASGNSTETVVAVAKVSNQTKNWTKVSGDAYIISFQQQDLIDYAGLAVNVYVYCNQNYQQNSTDTTTFNADAKWTVTDPSEQSTGDTGTGTGTTVTPWTSGSFYMSSAVAHSYLLPTEEAMTTVYNTEANPLDLGTVYVDRNVARFDIKDGSKGKFTYTITDTTTDGGEGPATTAATEGGDSYSLVLSEVALINMSKEFYALRHMAANSNTEGKDAANLKEVTLLTKEVTNNWVIDTDAEAKSAWSATDDSQSGSGTTTTAPTFYYSMDTPSSWEWTSLSDIVDSDNGKADNDKDWNSGTTNYGDYYIWRYATENTIPSVDQQQHGLTTGVVFKAEITGGEGTTLGGTDGKGRVYVFQNVLYPSWDAVKEAATGSEGNIDTESSIGYAYQAVMDAWKASQSSSGGNTETFDEYNSDVTTTMAEVGFTGYSPTTEGEGADATTHYYCYYYYWNRHNDNFNDGVMGIMEFGVVRNNVYKLSVTDILKYGHPLPSDSEEPGTTPDPDPDPVNPGTPDEETNIYMKVEVQVLPWVVRINDITF